MGGGGGGYRDIGDVAKLVQEAKEKLKPSNRKNVFISFAYEDHEDVNLLRAHSKNEKLELEFSDWSVKKRYESTNEDYVQRRIKERIERSSVTVVYLSEETAKSEWVKWEVETSLELGKTVLAVHKGDEAPSSPPTWVSEHNIEIVRWKDLNKSLE